jgi:TetR/AcrR family transcriptional repressor of nem operon
MKTLVIHPKDVTTDFLKKVYDGKSWTVIDGTGPNREFIKAIKEHDRIIMLGHGNAYGLIGEAKMVISPKHVYLLREKISIAIWCFAGDFFLKYGLNGFATGTFISEFEEAMDFSIPASMKDLVEATGLTTRSMYNLFGSKNGIFKACLNWYYEIGVRSYYEQLIREDGLEAIRHFFDILANRKTKDGCLYVNTASDRRNIDKNSIIIIDNYFENLKMIFKSKLDYANEHEGYECDSELRAKQLIVIVQGSSVYSKNIKCIDDNRKVIYGFLKLMNI